MEISEEKQIEDLLSKLKELESDMKNVIALGSEVKNFDLYLKRFLQNVDTD